MRLNENIALRTSKVLLVPYCEHHVATYHTWMQDAELQSATASEVLTLKEEYAMQQSWRTDRDKLTFIICLPPPFGPDVQISYEGIKAGKHDSEDQMIGDINLFLFQDEEEDENGSQAAGQSESMNVASNDSTPALIGEIELMIARKDLQHQGYGRNALITFMDYIVSNWQRIAQGYIGHEKHPAGTSASSLSNLAHLRARINQTNVRSIRLFESVGFVRLEEGTNYFGEVELRRQHDADGLIQLKWYEQPRELQYTEKE